MRIRSLKGIRKEKSPHWSPLKRVMESHGPAFRSPANSGFQPPWMVMAGAPFLSTLSLWKFALSVTSRRVDAPAKARTTPMTLAPCSLGFLCDDPASTAERSWVLCELVQGTFSRRSEDAVPAKTLLALQGARLSGGVLIARSPPERFELRLIARASVFPCSSPSSATANYTTQSAPDAFNAFV